MTGFIPKEKLTAYQRWELAAFDEEEQAAEPPAQAGAHAAETPPQAEAPEEPPLVLPTAADIERMHNEAHEQGYAAGYTEGLAEAQDVSARMAEILDSLQQAAGGIEQHVAHLRNGAQQFVAGRGPRRFDLFAVGDDHRQGGGGARPLDVGPDDDNLVHLRGFSRQGFLRHGGAGEQNSRSRGRHQGDLRRVGHGFLPSPPFMAVVSLMV